MYDGNKICYFKLSFDTKFVEIANSYYIVHFAIKITFLMCNV